MRRFNNHFMIVILPLITLLMLVGRSIAIGQQQPPTRTPLPAPIPTLYVGDSAIIYSAPYLTAPQITTTWHMNAGITGVTPDYAWFRISYGAGGPAWLLAEDVVFGGNLNQLPLTDYPPPEFVSAMQSPTAPIPFASPSFTPTPLPRHGMPTPTASRRTPLPSPTAAGNVRVELVPDLNADAYTNEHLLETARVLQARLQFFGMYDVVVEVKDNDVIVTEFRDNSRLSDFIASTRVEGHVAFIDLSEHSLEDRQHLIGTVTITDTHLQRIQTRYALASGQATVVPTPITTVPTAFNQYTGLPYQTVLTNADISNAYPVYDASIQANTLPNTEWGVQVAFTAGGLTTLATYTGENVGRLIGITIDNRLIATPLIETPSTYLTIYNTMTPFTEEQARIFASVITSGGLPVPVNVQSVVFLD